MVAVNSLIRAVYALVNGVPGCAWSRWRRKPRMVNERSHTGHVIVLGFISTPIRVVGADGGVVGVHRGVGPVDHGANDDHGGDEHDEHDGDDDHFVFRFRVVGCCNEYRRGWGGV